MFQLVFTNRFKKDVKLLLKSGFQTELRCIYQGKNRINFKSNPGGSVMDKATIDEVIDFLKQSLIRHGIQVDSIALFGSALTGNMDKDSDIDLIIISADFINLDLFERAIMTMKPETETLRKFKIPMDIINLSPDEYNNSNFRIFHKTRIVA